MKQKKDRIFIIVMAIIVGNLTYMLINMLLYLIIEDPTNVRGWAYTFTNIIGIIGALWLVREERKRRRIGKEKGAQETKS